MFTNPLSKFQSISASVAIIAGITVAGITTQTLVASADSKPLQIRYFEPYTSDGSLDDDNADKYVYKIGYVDKNGKSRRVTKTSEHINEYISDTGKATVKDDGYGNSAEVVRPPYQTFDVNVKSNKVISIGWTDFIRKHPGVKNSTLKVKWHEVINNSNIGSSDHPSVTVMEFAYKHQLYRIYLSYDSNGMNNYSEDISPEFTTPTLKFNSDGDMTFQRAPYNMYTQNAQSGTVTDK